VNCNEVKEHISEAVDLRLDARVKQAFEAHVGGCSSCRDEFELERLTKRYVSIALPRAQATSGLSARIADRLSRQRSRASLLSWPRPLWRPALAFGVLAVVAFLLFVSLPLNVHHLHTSPVDNNVVHQSLNNFDAVVAGTMKPSIVSDNVPAMKAYFSQRVSYNVVVPKTIDKCKLIGGMVSDYLGRPLSHLVYRDGDNVVYLYQVDMASVMDGKTLMIPTEAKEQLLKTGWYVRSPHPNCNLVMWLKDSTLCTAVADMDKDALISYLSYSEEE